MVRQIKKVTLQMIAGANVVTAVLMLLIGLSDRISPVSHPLMASAGLAMPLFIFLNLCFLVFFAIFKRRYLVVPFLGFLVCYFPIRAYCPLNVGGDAPEGAIKVLSYNVFSFATADVPEGEPNPIMQYIKESGAAIVCLQEAQMNSERIGFFKDTYQYCDTMKALDNGECVTLLSKYPILKKERIKYKSRGNVSAAFTLKIGADTVCVINNHLETTGLSKEDRSGFRNMVKGKSDSDTMRVESKRLLVKLGDAASIRALQADAVAEYVRNCRRSVILCGDFNDNPISYVHRTIANGLTDCYIATGNGPGFSYYHNAILVRIDNIMCSDEWRPYGCKVDRSIAASDHYPIYCWLEKSPDSKNK